MVVVRTILIAALLCVAGAAQARYALDATDTGCAADMNTDDCFGPTVTASNGPTILACQALSAAKQQCRTCIEQKTSTGAYAGYKYCGYVSVNAFCTCKNANTDFCSGEGSCAYY